MDGYLSDSNSVRLNLITPCRTRNTRVTREKSGCCLRVADMNNGDYDNGEKYPRHSRHGETRLESLREESASVSLYNKYDKGKTRKGRGQRSSIP